MVGFAGVPVGRVERLVAPYRGLYPVATLVDVARAVSMGVEVEFPGSAGSGLWVDNCVAGDLSNDPKQGGGGSTRAQFPGVAVWAAVECAAVGAVTEELRDSASSALRAVEERGLHVGGDGPLVTGFGDNRVVSMLTGGIPTVHFAYRTSGVKSAEMLVERIEDPGAVQSSTVMGYRIEGI